MPVRGRRRVAPRGDALSVSDLMWHRETAATPRATSAAGRRHIAPRQLYDNLVL